jgi:hypothetical protein
MSNEQMSDLRKKAEQGNTEAQTNLGFLYSRGERVPQDYAQAAKWFQQAAAQGDVTAQFTLGVLYVKGYGVPQDYAMARQWFEKAAAQDSATAQVLLGMLYDDEWGVLQDYAMAREWYEKAAAQGDADAQYRLGRLYVWGYGVPQDYAMARQWFEKAAAQEHAGAQFDLGLLYYNGWGVPQDYVKAYMWYSLAAASTGDVQKLAADNRDEVARRMTSAQLVEAQRLVRQCQTGQIKDSHQEGVHSFQVNTPSGEQMSEKVSCQEFADILAEYVLRQIKENRDGAPNPQFRRFAQSIIPDGDAENIDNEILFLLSFIMSQICAFHIDDRSYLDKLIPRFYRVLAASQRGLEPSIFEAIAIDRYKEYLEPYALDWERMVQRPKGMIPWKFMLSQFGKNLRSDFDFETGYSDFVPASIGLGEYFAVNMEFIKGTLDKLEFGNENS